MTVEFPQPLMDLCRAYVRGTMHRREFLEAANRYVMGGLALAALRKELSPDEVFGQAAGPRNSYWKWP
jgi:hypothetical protein